MISKAESPAPTWACVNRKKTQRGVGVRHDHEGRPRRGGLREKPQRRGGDDAQRALRPDQQVAQVIPHVVLAQARQRVHHRAVGQNRLDPEAEVAGIAVAQHVHAARIGRQKPPDPRGPLRGEREGKDQILRLGRGVDIGQDRACLHGHGPGHGVEGPDRTHPLERQDNRRRAILGQLPAHKPRAATEWNDRRTGRRTCADDRGQFVGLARRRNRGGLPMPAPARFFEIVRRDRTQRGLRQAGLDEVVEGMCHT
jgi:hypothetical protein